MSETLLEQGEFEVSLPERNGFSVEADERVV